MKRLGCAALLGLYGVREWSVNFAAHAVLSHCDKALPHMQVRRDIPASRTRCRFATR